MEISKQKLARFSRKLAINKGSKKRSISSSENVQPSGTFPNQVVFENSTNSKRKATRIPLSPLNPENIQPIYTNPNEVVLEKVCHSKRKASRIPLSPLNGDSITTTNAYQNIPSKRVRTPNPKYFTPLSCVTNTSNLSSGQSSTTTIQDPLGAENIQPIYTNPNEVVLEKVCHSKRKASRIPLSPLNGDSITTTNAYQNISSKRVRTPNPKYFTPLSCVTNTSNLSSGQSSTTSIQNPLGTETDLDSSSPSSALLNPTSKTIKGK
ncbi:hypothetical protein P8452_37927 [Trifolium repens]|nr:hypothetical protein P8452_37927 [Trifolium repens]